MNPETHHPSKNALWFGLVILILIVSLGGSVFYFYTQYRQSQAEIDMLKNNPDQVAKIETQKLVSAISKLMILPLNETPIDITVKDKELLKDQAIFANAENGDRMLIYSQAKKAILYRPSVNKLVEVFNNITLNNPTPTPAPAQVSAETPTPTPSLP